MHAIRRAFLCFLCPSVALTELPGRSNERHCGIGVTVLAADQRQVLTLDYSTGVQEKIKRNKYNYCEEDKKATRGRKRDTKFLLFICMFDELYREADFEGEDLHRCVKRAYKAK